MMNKLVEEFKTKRSSSLSTKDEKAIDNISKGLKEVIEKPTGSGQK